MYQKCEKIYNFTHMLHEVEEAEERELRFNAMITYYVSLLIVVVVVCRVLWSKVKCFDLKMGSDRRRDKTRNFCDFCLFWCLHCETKLAAQLHLICSEY